MIHSLLPHTPLRILGIDPGTAIVGWAVLEVDKNETKSIAYGHISTSPKKPHSQRILEISQTLDEIINTHIPTEASVEELFFFKNLKTAIPVAEARGAILLTLEKSGLSVFEYTPLQIKQALTGYGRAEKHQVQEMVKAVLKLPNIPKPDDTADALAVAVTHTNSRKMNQ